MVAKASPRKEGGVLAENKHSLEHAITACCLVPRECCFSPLPCPPSCCPATTTPSGPCCRHKRVILEQSKLCCGGKLSCDGSSELPRGWLSLSPPAPRSFEEADGFIVRAAAEKRPCQALQQSVEHGTRMADFSYAEAGETRESLVGQHKVAYHSVESLSDSCLLNICSRITDPQTLAAVSMTCVRFYQISSLAKVTLKLLSNPGDAFFRSLLVRFINVTNLELPLHHGSSFFTDSSCQILASVRLPLKSLNLEKQSNITDAGLIAIANAFPQLDELTCTGCLNITDKGLCAIAACCQKLRVLRLCYCRSVTSSSLAVISTSCPSLSVLELTEKCGFAGGWLQLKDLTLQCDACECNNTLESIINTCPVLSRLSLRFCCKLGKGLESLRTREQQLDTLVLDSCMDVPPEIFSDGWPSLSALHVRTSAINDTTLDAIAKGCPSLEELRFTSCADITDDGIINIASCCTMLKVLDVGQCPRVTHSELVACAVGLSPSLLRIGLPRQCFGAKHLKAVSRHGWTLDMQSAQWQLIREHPCLCSSCSLRHAQHIRSSAFLPWGGR